MANNPPSTRDSVTVNRSLTSDETGLLLLIIALTFGAWFRFLPAFTADFLINDGGLFYWISENIPEDSRFVVITGQVDLFRDWISEWFPAPTVWTSLLFQGVVVSFASYLVWFSLLRTYLASRLSVFSFMTPLFGVAFGVLLLHEPLTASFVGGAVLVLCGITLVSRATLPAMRPRRP